jgi:hypothetical protein
MAMDQMPGWLDHHYVSKPMIRTGVLIWIVIGFAYQYWVYGDAPLYLVSTWVHVLFWFWIILINLFLAFWYVTLILFAAGVIVALVKR